MNENERLIGESPEFSALLEQASTVAPLHKPVLVVGERGTGKEGIASRLHFLSNRWEEAIYKAQLCGNIRLAIGERTLRP